MSTFNALLSQDLMIVILVALIACLYSVGLYMNCKRTASIVFLSMTNIPSTLTPIDSDQTIQKHIYLQVQVTTDGAFADTYIGMMVSL